MHDHAPHVHSTLNLSNLLLSWCPCFAMQAAANSLSQQSRQQQAGAMAALPIPARELFINGRWVAPVRGKYLDVVCPATEAVIGRIPAGALHSCTPGLYLQQFSAAIASLQLFLQPASGTKEAGHAEQVSTATPARLPAATP